MDTVDKKRNLTSLQTFIFYTEEAFSGLEDKSFFIELTSLRRTENTTLICGHLMTTKAHFMAPIFGSREICIYLETHESVNKPKVLIGSHPASPQQYPVVNANALPLHFLSLTVVLS